MKAALKITAIATKTMRDIGSIDKEIAKRADVGAYKAGMILRNAMVQKILQFGGWSGRVYGSHQASAPGEPPHNKTGNLARSISIIREKTGVIFVVVRAKYAKALEFGTRKMAARPFATPSYEEKKDEMQEAFMKEVKE
jgi:HK97 gp10 family phage protein